MLAKLSARRTLLWLALALVAGLVIVLSLVFWIGPGARPPATPTPTSVPETLIPTPLPGSQEDWDARQPLANTVHEVVSLPDPVPYTLRWRAGVGIAGTADPLIFAWPDPRPGWSLNWTVGYTTSTTLDQEGEFSMHTPGLGMAFAPMVRVFRGEIHPEAAEIRELARRNPGRIWLIGNEPDVPWQDNATPEQYVTAYHAAYTAIKAADPTAQVAIAGLSQITPLRLAYLDRVWQGYQDRFGHEMPVDIWNMHAFVLREEAGSWGVSIPPGFEDVTHGMLWDIPDHDNLALVENQVRLMRRWMLAHGQRQKPLYITEYGILMPSSYGFPPTVVVRFLVGSFDLFHELRDPDMGYSADDDRLVQRWAWFSTRVPAYPAGNLFGRDGKPTPVMRSMSAYIRAMSPQIGQR